MRHPPGEDIFLEWRQRFGPIFTFWLGETPIICIAEYNKIVEYYQRGGEAFAGRHAIEAYEKIIRGGIYGVLQTEGEVWREHRRFVLHVFRDFGVGKNIMQERILTEISEMFKLLDFEINLNKEKNEIDIVKHLERAISSIINVLLVGFRFDEEHEQQYHQLNNQLWRFNNRMQSFATNLFMWRPDIFKSFPLCQDAYNLVRNTHHCFFGFFQEQIDKHLNELKEKLNNNENNENNLNPPLDFMEAFLREKFRFDEEKGQEHETTTTALSWGIALLLHNPSVMEKVQVELDNKFGNEQQQMISWSDRSSLPYTCAVVNEILRVGNVVAQDFPHRMMKDTKVDKWLLRKGQPIVAQISVVLIDPDIFSDPKSFRPERFLDENGNLLKSDHLIPFGLGKRQCLGESLARMELFLFFANIFNRYTISPGNSMPSLKREIGIPVLCPKFTCRVIKRRKEII
uniref:Cytochrome P450 n=1 Tax=Meloidogyne hapla TaxID=6305 RepID=A0A1I8AYA8_MELHA